MGEANDIYERQADRVADAVVSGETAASLLDQAPSDADAPATYAADSPLQMAGGRILKRLGGMGDAVSGLCPGGEPGRHNAA